MDKSRRGEGVDERYLATSRCLQKQQGGSHMAWVPQSCRVVQGLSGCPGALTGQEVGEVSWQLQVVGVVPQALLSVPLNPLFQKQLNSELAQPAADITLFTAVKTKTVCEGLQKEPEILSDWVIKWQMKFIVNKCRLMHMEENNLNCTCTVMDSK